MLSRAFLCLLSVIFLTRYITGVKVVMSLMAAETVIPFTVKSLYNR